MRFTYHKNPHGSYVVEDSLGKLPLLFFTDLNATLRCVNELNKLDINKQSVLDMLSAKQVECMHQMGRVGKETTDNRSIGIDDIPDSIVKRFEFKMSVLHELYEEFKR